MLSFDVSLKRRGFSLTGTADIPLRGITGISGKSGSGKTTLLRALAGLERDIQGRISFAGQSWANLPPQERPVGFVFQDLRLFRHLNVGENIGYGAARRQTSDDLVADVISSLDLGQLLHRKPASLSGGEARRVALARALASGPKILFLDEPMVGLDPDRRAEILPYITGAVDRFDLAVLYVSHSQFEMSMLADRILPVSNGRIGDMQPGPPRFSLPMIRRDGVNVVFAVDGHEFVLPGTGNPDDVWELRPGAGSVLAENHPGENSAAAVLPVDVVAAEDAHTTVRIADQILELPTVCGAGAGSRQWLICPQIRGRHRSPL